MEILRCSETVETPHEQLRGWLKNGNSQGDFSTAARCGAKNRRGTPCKCPAMANGRCRLHGGLSTGARTAEGIERIQQAVTKHGRYSNKAKKEKAHHRELVRHWRAMLATGGKMGGSVIPELITV